MTRILSSLTARVIGVFVAGLLFSSCFGEGGDQLSGMYDLSFPSTAVCNSQVKLAPFRNVSGAEIVIEGAAISGGTDPMNNFALQSIVIGSEEQPSINGVLEELHIPAGASYSFKIAYVPKFENESNEAVLDIAYKAPREGIIQVALKGISAGTVGDCSGEDDPGGPVGPEFDGEMILTIESLAAATSAIGQPIKTDQGVVDFVPVDIPVVLSASGSSIELDPFDGESFVLPKPKPEVPLIGKIMRGSIIVTIPDGGSGIFDPATGLIKMPHVRVVMNGALDFYAELDITLTTGRINVNSISPLINVSAWPYFGSPSHYSPKTAEVFGSPIDATTGKVFLVGLTNPEKVQVYGDSEFKSLSTSSMAVLMEGTLHKAP